MTHNLDRTTLHIVRKGVTVRDAMGQCGQVVRTSKGACLVMWPGNRYAETAKCRELEVIDTGIKRRELTTQQREAARDLRARIAILANWNFNASADALRAQLRHVLGID